MKKITILIPCYNEEKGIGKVIKGVPVRNLRKLGFKTEIVVIDNNSTDNTFQIAKRHKVTVLSEEKLGKGNAIRKGFLSISKDTNYVVMLDGDDTYKAKEIPRLIEPLDSGFCDVVVGSRLLGRVNDGAFKLSNRVVNWGYAFMVRQFYRANVTDVLSGFFAWRREALDDLKIHLSSDGFAIEMEMITKMVKIGHSVYSVPITYDIREGESKINSLRDGLLISKMFFRNLFWKPTISGSEIYIPQISFKKLSTEKVS
jgi:dolichol-phosphate mannosyltransferase